MEVEQQPKEQQQPTSQVPDTSLIQEPHQWQFKVGLFLAKHKILFKRLFYFGLFFVNIIILINLGVRWVNYSTQTKAHNRMMQLLDKDLIDYQTFRTQNRPQELKILKTEIIQSGPESYDLVARVSNNNQGWMPNKLGYQFMVDDQLLPSAQTHILPQQTKLITAFNVHKDTQPNEVKFFITDMGWQKITDHQRMQIYKNIRIKQAEFSLDDNRAEWQVLNNSAYGFWSIGFQVVLYNGSHEIIGVNYFVGRKIKAMDEKFYSVKWYNELPAVYDVEVIPDVNIFDQAVYMPIDVNGYQPTKPF